MDQKLKDGVPPGVPVATETDVATMEELKAFAGR
jgi:hypothetical protein